MTQLPAFARSRLGLSILLAWSGTLAAQTTTTTPGTPSPTADAARPASAEPVQLPEVTIRASADASAEGLKPPYAGGQVARGGRVGVLGSLDVMDAPFSATNYTAQLIQNQQAASVGDVLLNDPAVRLARGFGNYQQLYIVRGFPIYSDDMAYNGLYGLLPRQYLAAELLERVEVIHGANSFLNGAAPGGSGLGGAVNVMPKRAPNEALTQLSVGVESGPQGMLALDVARRFGPGGNTGLRVNLVRRDGDTAVDGEGRELTAVVVGLDHRSGGLRLSADIGHQDHRISAAPPNVTIAAGLPIPDAPDASNALAQPWTRSNERDTFGTLRGEFDLAPNLTVWAAAGARHGDEATDFANPTVTDASGTTSAFRFVGSRTDKVVTGDAGVRGTFQTGSVDHAFSASIAAFRFDSDAPYAFSDFGPVFLGTIVSNLRAPTSTPPPPATALLGTSITEIRTSSIAVADTLSFMHDTVRLTLGARDQRIRDGGYDESRVTPVAGLVVKPVAGVSLFANYIEGLVKGPVAPAEVNGVVISNRGEVFAPFRSKQTELGAKFDAGRIGGSLSVYTSSLPVGRAIGDRFGIAGEQKNRGAELSVYGELARGLRLLGGISALNARLKDTGVAATEGRRAIGVPETQLNASVEWDVPGLPGLTLTGRVLQTAAQYADATNQQRLPSWARFDLGARYETEIADRPVSFRARVDNVADRNYWASAGGYPGAGYLVLGAPRTLTLTASVDF